MIDKKRHPVSWAMLMYELTDAQEHLESMISVMTTDTEFDEAEFGVHLAHVFAHLNRAWNKRNLVEETPALSGSEWTKYAHFPDDLEPL